MRNRIFLIGFMGSGKSTVGEKLASLTGFKYVDMDKEIEIEDDAPIREIFIKRGEHHFRNMEGSLLDKLVLESNIVVSCGGGIILDSVNVDLLKETNSVFFLECEIETLFSRVKDDENRPFAFLDGSSESDRFIKFANLYEKRKPIYYDAAAEIIDTNGKSPEEIAQFIFENYFI